MEKTSSSTEKSQSTRKSKYDGLTQEEIEYEVTYRKSRWAFHMAGIVPVVDTRADFNMPWDDFMMPVAANYTAIERAVVEQAFAGARTIWLVCSPKITPLIKERLGEWMRDPLSIWKPSRNISKEIRIPIYYAQLDYRDLSKDNTIAWSILYGACTSYLITRRISKWVTPDKYYVSFPQGVYPDWTPRQYRKFFRNQSNLFLSHNGETAKDGKYLGFTFTKKDIEKYTKRLDKNISMNNSKSVWSMLPTKERNSSRFFSLDNILESATINSEQVEIPWYYSIDTWDDYCLFLGSEERTLIERPRNNEIIKPNSKWSLIGEEREQFLESKHKRYEVENEPPEKLQLNERGHCLKSPLKWAGGKYRLLEQIKKVLPEGNRLVEPFVGAGSVFLNLNYSNYWINDINKDLINLYQVIQTNHRYLLEQVENLFKCGNNKESYYFNRQIFNERKQDKITQASLFLYLNRHCFNGLCRYNKKNQFNVPFGKYKTIYLPEKEITNTHKRLQNVKITSLSFEEVFSDIKQGDVIYCDPPYHNTFAQYASGGFNKADHQKLANLSCGLDVVISNSYNEETLAIFNGADEIHKTEASRAISRDANGRKRVYEMLAVFAVNHQKAYNQ